MKMKNRNLAPSILPAFLFLFLFSLLPINSHAQADYSEINQTETTQFEETTEPAFKKVSYYRYAKKKIWLYQKNGTSFQKLKTVKKSSRLKVTGLRTDGWARISFSGVSLYAKTSALSTTNGYTVVIDAGHQQKANSSLEPIGPGAKQKKAKVTGGATGVRTRQPEYKLNLKVAKQLRDSLKAKGYHVVMVRTTHKVNISNSARAKIANKAKADVFIRIHANSAGSSGTKGALTICPTKKNPYCKKIYKASKQLSESVLNEFCKATKAKNRGVMYTDSMSGINWSKVPVTIIEMGFLSNPSEDKKMASAAYQKKMVKGMVNGIDAYLGR